MGIDQNLFEAANIDGANSLQVFFRVTLPLLMPVLVYTIITALIGGLQMFDVPQVLTNGAGTPNRSSTTPHHVPEQLPENQQELRHGGSRVGHHLPHYRGF